jgi:hypothetical protein
MFKINTPTSVKNHLTGEMVHGIKEKKLNMASPIKGRSRVKLVNAETGALEYEASAENLIKDSVYRFGLEYMRMCMLNLGMADRYSGAEYALARDIHHKLDRLYLYDDASQTESANQIGSEGTLLGWAELYYTYLGTSTAQGSVELALCNSFSDVTNKQNVFRFVISFPQNAANGKFNKIALGSWQGLKFKRYDNYYYYSTNEYTTKYKSLCGHADYVTSDIKNRWLNDGWMYMVDSAGIKNKTTTKFWRMRVDDVACDVETGYTLSNTVEEIGEVDFSFIGTQHYNIETRWNSWSATYYVVNFIDPTTCLYSFWVSLYNKKVYKINITTGFVEYLGSFNVGYQYTNSPTNSDSNREGDKHVLSECGAYLISATGTKNDRGRLSVHRISDGARLCYYQFDAEILYAHEMYTLQLIGEREVLLDTSRMCKTFKFNETYTDVLSILDVREDHGGYGKVNQYTHYLYDLALNKFYNYYTNQYMSIDHEPSSSIMAVNLLPEYIYKNNTQIMRIEYDVIVPWDVETILHHNADERDWMTFPLDTDDSRTIGYEESYMPITHLDESGYVAVLNHDTDFTLRQCYYKTITGQVIKYDEINIYTGEVTAKELTYSNTELNTDTNIIKVERHSRFLVFHTDYEAIIFYNGALYGYSHSLIHDSGVEINELFAGIENVADGTAITTELTLFNVTDGIAYASSKTKNGGLAIKPGKGTNATHSFTLESKEPLTGNFMFYHWCEGENSHDYSDLYVNGVQILDNIRDSSWRLHVAELDNETLTITCNYTKDGSVDYGADMAVISGGVSLTVTGTPGTEKKLLNAVDIFGSDVYTLYEGMTSYNVNSISTDTTILLNTAISYPVDLASYTTRIRKFNKLYMFGGDQSVLEFNLQDGGYNEYTVAGIPTAEYFTAMFDIKKDKVILLPKNSIDGTMNVVTVDLDEMTATSFAIEGFTVGEHFDKAIYHPENFIICTGGTTGKNKILKINLDDSTGTYIDTTIIEGVIVEDLGKHCYIDYDKYGDILLYPHASHDKIAKITMDDKTSMDWEQFNSAEKRNQRFWIGGWR